MPTIKRLKDRKRKPSARKKERQSLYGRKDYRDQVNWYKRQHIWCQECIKDGLYTPGIELHHIQSPFQGDLTNEEQLRLLYDQSNWMLLCNYHHRLQHHTVSQAEIDAYRERIERLRDHDKPNGCP